MKKVLFLVLLSVCLSLFAGCALQKQEPAKLDAIPFAEGQYYAAAYLGYQQIDDLDYYVEKYLDCDQVSIHYLSDGDYYLVIPRYAGMELSLFQNDMMTAQSALVYEDPDCRHFIVQCNVSDIFADATIRLTYEGETMEFSPFISLMDGSVDIGEHGLDLTKDTGSQPPEA